MQRKVGPGQFISSGASDPVFVIGDLSTVWLTAFVRESEAADVAVGQEIDFTVLALSGRDFTARIDYVAAAIDPTTRRLLVRATIDNKDGLFKPEMFANVTIYAAGDHTSVGVPQAGADLRRRPVRLWVAHDDKSHRTAPDQDRPDQWRSGRGHDGNLNPARRSSPRAACSSTAPLPAANGHRRVGSPHRMTARRLRSQSPVPDGRAVRRRHGRRPDRVPAAEHRGLSRSDAADGRHRHPEPGAVGGGNRALHHHSAGDAGRRPQEPERDPHDLAVRPVRRQAAVLLRLHLRAGVAAGAEPAAQLAPLPNNAQPQISPLSPIGEIYRYRLVGPPDYSVLDLKTLQDWVLQRRFRAVPGVIDVTGWGGKTKTYELQVDFNKLVANGLTLPQLLQAVSNSNINVGGNTVNIGSQSAVVRGVGLIRSIDSLANTMISSSNGNAVLVRDVANVEVGEQPQLDIAGENQDDDIVQGIVLMRRGEQSSPTIARVEELSCNINNSTILPPGVRIERIYDRKDLIEITTRTVLENMVVGIGLIVCLQWIFLGDLRSALIVGATIPFALFFAVSILVLCGESANLLVGRRHRFWSDRRCHRHYGGSDFPAAGSHRAALDE